MSEEDAKYKKKYDKDTWKTTGPNKQRNLRNIKYSLNEDDYTNPDDYSWDEMLSEIISQAITDLARCNSSSDEYISAHKFIFGDGLDMWCIAFGRNMDTHLIRKKAKDIIMYEKRRDEFLRHVYDQQIRRRTNGSKNRGNNQVVQADGVSGEGDKELPMGDEDSCSEL